MASIMEGFCPRCGGKLGSPKFFPSTHTRLRIVHRSATSTAAKVVEDDCEQWTCEQCGFVVTLGFNRV